MRTPTLETERLILRPITTADAQVIFDTWASDPRVTKYMIYTTHESVEVTKEWLRDCEAHIDDPLHFDWGFVLKGSGRLIGSGGSVFNAEENRYNLGYNIAYDCWNKGYTTEAARAIVDFIRDIIGFKQMVCEHAKDNPASGRVMEKVGFHYVRDGSYKRFNGEVLEAKIYELD